MKGPISVATADKIMFEIYRETGYDQQYRVVYFTELAEHNKEREIGRAMAGDHFFDGFLGERESVRGKQLIESILGRLNGGEALSGEAAARELTEAGVLSV
ncbi:MAG: hypothetical protein ACE5EQ_01660 [Phycisphaerae bacterium]